MQKFYVYQTKTPRLNKPYTNPYKTLQKPKKNLFQNLPNTKEQKKTLLLSQKGRVFERILCCSE